MNRKIAFTTLVGSHNYNLNTPESDKDYKAFFIPSFDELYSGEKYSKALTSDSEDIEYHDLRKLPDMLWKSNVNFLEVLFSVEVKKENTEFGDVYKELRDRNEEIARMNLSYLFDACMGMYNKKYREYQRDLNYIMQDNMTNSEQWKAKVNKHAMSALRILNFLDRYANTGFTDFQSSIWYEDTDKTKSHLLDVRYGKVENLNDKLQETEMLVVGKLKELYKSQKPELNMQQYVYDTIKSYIENYIVYELR